MSRVPPDAFQYYVKLGEGRSYRAVAARFGLSKSTIAQAACLGRWQERLAEFRDAELRAVDERMLAIWDEKIAQHVLDLHRRIESRVNAIVAMPTKTMIQVIHQMMAAIHEQRRLLGLTPYRRSRF